MGEATKPQLEVRLEVDDIAGIAAQVGPRGMFLPDERPPAVGTVVAVQFVDPLGQPLSRVLCRVIPTPAEAAGLGPGMALEVVELDPTAAAVLQAAPAAADHSCAAGAQTEVLTTFFESAEEGPAVGIDLGTTYSCVAVVENGQPRVIKSPEGYETVPSVVYLTPERKLLVGHKAVEKMTLDPSRAVYGSKRFIGRPFTPAEARTYGHFFHYQLAPDRGGRFAARIGDVVIPLEVVAAAILGHLKQMAEAALGCAVKRAVVTVPAYFGEAQRSATVRAGTLAGLTVERILNEPTAGAVAYGYGRGLASTILVYDLGGGTFDASVLRVEGDAIRVLATDGEAFLGGTDFDDRLTEVLVSHIEKEHGVELREDRVAMQRLRHAAEQAKCQLSDGPSVTVEIPYLTTLPTGPLNVSYRVEQALLEQLTTDLVDRTMKIVQAVLDVARVRTAELDDVILVGGQSRAPLVRHLLVERFGKQPTRKVHPDLAIALGAAIVAAAKADETTVQLTDVLPASLRLGAPDGTTRAVLRRGTQLPAMCTVEVVAGDDGVATVSLLRGEAVSALENEPLGGIQLPGVPPGARVSVTLVVNVQGLLSATAEHPQTGVEHELEVALLDGHRAPAPAESDSYFEM